MRKQLILIFTVLILIPLLMVGFLTNNVANKVFEVKLENSLQDGAENINLYLDSFFKQYEKNIDMYSKNIDAVKIIEHPDYEPFLLGLFDNYLESHELAKNIYMGTRKKDMFLRPEQELPGDYDPTGRPWYKKAEKTKDLVWTDPYRDASTNDLIVTGAKSVYNGEEFVGVVGLDLDLSTLSKNLNGITVGRSGYIVLLDSHNKTLTHPDPEVIGKEIPIEKLKKEVESKDSGYVKYNYNGEDKYSYFITLNTTGWKILITQSTEEISDSLQRIRNTILIIGIISLLIALIIAFVYSKFPTKQLQEITTEMNKVKEGNLNSKTNIKSNTEIGEVSGRFNEMVLTLKDLVSNIKTAVHNIETEAENLAATSEETSASAAEVTRAVEEIAHGATSQSHDTDEAVTLTNTLDKQFSQLMNNTNTMLSSASKIDEKKEVGITSVKMLEEKTSQNNEATSAIEDAINGLESKSENIGNILETITDISEQTNLLALNASIEAARAGEHGKGFAVVADEIRKLAEESSEAADKISLIIKDIQNETQRTVSIMDQVTERSSEQTEAVKEVDKVFRSISNSIEKIGEVIQATGDFIQEMNDNKEKIVASIENISSVSEESAAGAEEVTASMDQQNLAVEDVAKAAENLSHLAAELTTQVRKFDL